MQATQRASSVRKSTAGRSEEHTPHLVQFYDESAFPARSVADFLWASLEAGGSAIVLASPDHARAIEQQLSARGAATDTLRERGRLVVRDARATVDAFMAGDLPDPDRFLRLVGGIVDGAIDTAAGGRVHAFGECVAILADEAKVDAAVAVEHLWNEVLSTRPCALYCAYPLRQFDVEALALPFLAVCDAHSEVVPVSELPGDPGRHGRCVAVLEQQARALERVADDRAEALRRLAEADRRKDDFLAMLGHELRNPLAPIVTALDLLDRRGDACCRRERGIMRRQTEHLQRLVDDLLDVARITRGKIELQPSAIELGSAVQRAIELTGPLVEQRGHRLTTSVPLHGLPVRADPVRLCQIIGNLLTNAATYTRRSGHIALSARREDAEVVLDVTDDGEGIRPEMLPTIFELFVQGERTLDRTQGGLGLGLPLARRLAELHGGTLSARSEGPGSGSTFTLRLPALKGADLLAPSPPSARRRVLLVDDNQDAADMLREALVDAGYDVSLASDGREALAMAEEAPPDIAVLDIGLPEMDGYELATRLRAACPEMTRMVAITGYGQERDRDRSRAAGFDVHLVKPVALAALIAALEG